MWGACRMKWFRSRAKHGARLALFALAVQFVLSFGHFHWDAAEAAPAIAPIAGQSTAVHPSDGPAAVPTVRTDPASHQKPDRHPADTCAICVAMAMAGSAMFAEPPLLMLPQAYHFLYLTTDAEFSHLGNERVVFQPRAPPAS